MVLSVVIPARNEAANLETTLPAIYKTLSEANIEHELIVVNDGSTDSTPQTLEHLRQTIPSARLLTNHAPHGFGFAVRAGLENFRGQAVAVVMADGSDDPNDLVKFFRAFQSTGCDCVFGNRFASTSIVRDYPFHKMVLNRIVNRFIQLTFGLDYGDITNAFKLYSAETIRGLKPFLSAHFNLTVELPLKSIVRGYTYTVVPNHWYGREHGTSKLKIKEMGSRYLFMILYCFIEKWLSCGDYRRQTQRQTTLASSK